VAESGNDSIWQLLGFRKWQCQTVSGRVRQWQCLAVIGIQEMTVPGSKWQSQAMTVSGSNLELASDSARHYVAKSAHTVSEMLASGNVSNWQCQALSDGIRQQVTVLYSKQYLLLSEFTWASFDACCDLFWFGDEFDVQWPVTDVGITASVCSGINSTDCCTWSADVVTSNCSQRRFIELCGSAPQQQDTWVSLSSSWELELLGCCTIPWVSS